MGGLVQIGDVNKKARNKRALLKVHAMDNDARALRTHVLAMQFALTRWASTREYARCGHCRNTLFLL